MALTSSRFGHILHALLQRISGERYAPFRINSVAKAQTFVRLGPKKIVMLEEQHVVSVAHQLEATLVMGEEMEGEQPVALEFTNTELAHFVAYVRQLDETYRVLLKHSDNQRQRIFDLEYTYENKARP